ncbi:helix-turn-helix transcriptional regulator [Listeria monocytogenes]|uniref:helix-turn-helix domain-containing protein n=1 Tax=Listeria seeligeri TaxID=1640 RepID=UPI00162AA107|nr:helix-turn-helix transcriptional regulator [Listeria seeligeri]EEO3664217.1 helix-turn-helix transcriptional regulator [Listeria monocytogenes]EIA6531398.1 helix-turn-helix transcriptional regulator [Listeria monocytogenes]MBC1884283.1 helix-turn-helix transcriptional regulator [Listeria seeligeri]MBC2017038.1 helix-turn-helix transcriptional regulator [Listeria seeligeri]HBZ6456191.1 helix-turn-helix transcriptional regulator [Listeria monocytogenes]
MDIYERIKKLAEINGYTIKELEKELGLSPNTLYKWKKQSPSIDRASKVASFFGVSIDFLIGSPANEAETMLQKALKINNAKSYSELLDLINSYYPGAVEESEKYIIIYDRNGNIPTYHLDKGLVFNDSPEIISDLHEDVEYAIEAASKTYLEEFFSDYDVT